MNKKRSATRKQGRMFVEKSLFYKHLTPFGVKQNDGGLVMYLIYNKLYLKSTDRYIELMLTNVA